jgi:CRP-like cAMP-binding protein
MASEHANSGTGGSGGDPMIDALAELPLFTGLKRPELETIAHTFVEEWYPAGQRILRQGFSGTGFYVILDGDASVRIDGEERARLSRGEFFGEVSVLLGDAPVADVVALQPLRVLHLPGPQVEPFLKAHPTVMYRMLQSQARRLRAANRWRG